MPPRSKLPVKPQKPGNKPAKAHKLSRLNKPAEMTLEEWQIELRKQFGREQRLRLRNLGEHSVFSEFQVSNPESRSSYRVRVGGPNLGDNSCTCPDYATNTLGTWMHELLERQLKKKGLGYVLFHGGVPSPQRKGLIDRFREDPTCKVFLSTDAGGLGLNLQFASVVFNMDLPWNPAVLEQRIGRVHRLGQRQPVRVVNFVSKNTIEEGMLGVLSFKKSLFAGVLDGGEPNISLGGTRLSKFMETVQSVTAQIPTTPADDEARGALTEFDGSKKPSGGRSSEEDADEAKPASAGDPWSELLRAGMALLQRITAPKDKAQAPSPSELIQRDEATGENYLRLPVPNPELVDQALKVLGGFLESFRK